MVIKRDYFTVKTSDGSIRISRDISAHELKELLKLYRDIPEKECLELLSLMADKPIAILIVNPKNDFSSRRFERKTEHVYVNHFSEDTEFWI